HLVVLAQHLRLELREPLRPRDGEQMLEEDRADAAALVRVGDRERDLSGVRPLLDDRVAADADDPLLAVLEERGDERDAAIEVEARERVELLLGEPALGAEEAEVDRTRAQTVEVVEQTLAVVRADGADVDRAAVAKERLGGVLADVGDRARVARALPAWRARPAVVSRGGWGGRVGCSASSSVPRSARPRPGPRRAAAWRGACSSRATALPATASTATVAVPTPPCSRGRRPTSAVSATGSASRSTPTGSPAGSTAARTSPR